MGFGGLAYDFGCRFWTFLRLLPIRGEPGAPPTALSCVMLPPHTVAVCFTCDRSQPAAPQLAGPPQPAGSAQPAMQPRREGGVATPEVGRSAKWRPSSRRVWHERGCAGGLVGSGTLNPSSLGFGLAPDDGARDFKLRARVGVQAFFQFTGALPPHPLLALRLAPVAGRSALCVFGIWLSIPPHYKLIQAKNLGERLPAVSSTWHDIRRWCRAQGRGAWTWRHVRLTCIEASLSSASLPTAASCAPAIPARTWRPAHGLHTPASPVNPQTVKPHKHGGAYPTGFMQSPRC
jgi:hypothetical protein